MTEHLPSALGPEIRTKTCLYTLTPDRDFVIDAVPGHPEVLVALGGAHAFKFASMIGRTLADLATNEVTDVDLKPFRVDRDLLTQEHPPTSWMV
jgi:sarcosine oxidase